MSEEMKITLEDAKQIISYIRENIESYLEKGKRLTVPNDLEEKFQNKAGAFVTLNKYNVSGNPLRGCIGYIEPDYKLSEVIQRVSVSAACEDPRFPSVSREELDDLVIEISILTPPKLLEVDDPKDYLEKIKIGKHGLIVEKGMRRGLLLPQVPVDHNRNWDPKTFLEQTCQKAWLQKDDWKKKETNVYSFTAILFEEKEPRGQVVRKEIGE